jgi:hypothetical protein
MSFYYVKKPLMLCSENTLDLEEVTVAYLKGLPLVLHGGTEENYKK